MLEGLELPPGRPLRVDVPASTSNLGPGFDLLGLALSLHLSVTVEDVGERDADAAVVEAETPWPEPGEDLLLVAFERAFRAFGGVGGRRRFRVSSEIPLGRGLGSSGAAIVAGLLLGAALAPGAVSREEILALALALEGHPDNVAPALLGGCVMAVPRAGVAPRIVELELHPALAFSVAWPAATLATRFARNLLPLQVDFADAVENPRRLALLLEGLRTADAELLTLGGEDRLHVPYRLEHIPGGAAALAAAQGAGASLATISGSGTALVAISTHDDAAAVAHAMETAFRAAGQEATGRVVEPVYRAASPVVV
jgi:homoserine kinase